MSRSSCVPIPLHARCKRCKSPPNGPSAFNTSTYSSLLLVCDLMLTYQEESSFSRVFCNDRPTICSYVLAKTSTWNASLGASVSINVFSSVPNPCHQFGNLSLLTLVALRILSASNWGLYPGKFVTGNAGGGEGIEVPKNLAPWPPDPCCCDIPPGGPYCCPPGAPYCC